MLRAIIFDFDGTILDTEMPWFRAWQEVYGQHGVELALHEWAKVVGTSDEGFDPVAHLEGLTGETIERADAEPAVRERALALIGKERLREGCADLLDAAHARGLRVGLASSASREWVEGHLGRLGILDRFDALCTRDDAVAVKPDPALYLLALEQLRIAASEAVAIEDSPERAARRAGGRARLRRRAERPHARLRLHRPACAHGDARRGNAWDARRIDHAMNRRAIGEMRARVPPIWVPNVACPLPKDAAECPCLLAWAGYRSPRRETAGRQQSPQLACLAYYKVPPRIL